MHKDLYIFTELLHLHYTNSSYQTKLMKQKTRISILIILVAAIVLIACYSLGFTSNYIDLIICAIIIATLGYWKYCNRQRSKVLADDARRLYLMLGGTADVSKLTNEFSLAVNQTICQFIVSPKDGLVKVNCLFTLAKEKSNTTNECLKKAIRKFQEKNTYWEDRIKLVWRNLPDRQFAGTITLEWDTELDNKELDTISAFLKEVSASI